MLSALNRLEPELAEKFFAAALNKSPNDTGIMDALADVKLQLGDQVTALELLIKSTEQAPTENPVKWLYLAQLKENLESLECYKTGIKLICDMIQLSEANDAMVRWIQSLVYCKILYIWMFKYRNWHYKSMCVERIVA